MNIFILEDEIYRAPRNAILRVLDHKHKLTVAVSCKDAKSRYKGEYDLLLLDHDMRGFFEPSTYHNTGFQFALWLIEMGVKFPRPKVILHSQNWEGRANMAKVLLRAGFPTSEFPFSSEYVKMLSSI